MSINQRILVPPVGIGDHIYTKGRKNTKTPEKWDVVFLGYDGETWYINIVLTHNGKFVKSMQIEDNWLDDGIYYTDPCYIHYDKE